MQPLPSSRSDVEFAFKLVNWSLGCEIFTTKLGPMFYAGLTGLICCDLRLGPETICEYESELRGVDFWLGPRLLILIFLPVLN